MIPIIRRSSAKASRLTVFVDPARLKTVLLAFVESLVWWATEGPVRIGASRRDGTFEVWASRHGSELTSETRRGAVHAAASG